jgi:hypothetical protein
MYLLHRVSHKCDDPFINWQPDDKWSNSVYVLIRGWSSEYHLQMDQQLYLSKEWITVHCSNSWLLLINMYCYHYVSSLLVFK